LNAAKELHRTMGPKFRITQAAELKSLERFRDFVERHCQPQGIDSQTCYDLMLAVDEACTNIITHGYAGMNPGSIILELELQSRQVIIRITDFGHPFEPYEPEAPDVSAMLEDRPTGGFGLFLIYNTMDGVDYRATGEGNTLILKKRL
jgi:anti-sigma regulatory factor (Ser/Thr protein kinase)